MTRSNPRLSPAPETTAAIVTLYVNYMPLTASCDDLRARFAPYGAVAAARLVTHEDGRAKGYGFVDMLSFDDAVTAIADQNGAFWDTKRLSVSMARSPSSSASTPTKSVGRRRSINEAAANPRRPRIPHHASIMVEPLPVVETNQADTLKPVAPALIQAVSVSEPAREPALFIGSCGDSDASAISSSASDCDMHDAQPLCINPITEVFSAVVRRRRALLAAGGH